LKISMSITCSSSSSSNRATVGPQPKASLKRAAHCAGSLWVMLRQLWLMQRYGMPAVPAAICVNCTRWRMQMNSMANAVAPLLPFIEQCSI
jgi:hypothetical protein